MMLTSVVGACTKAPRQNGLKKPRPLRPATSQYKTALSQDDDAATRRKVSGQESLELSESTDADCVQVCQDILDISSKLFAFVDDEEIKREKFKSSSSYTSYDHCQMFGSLNCYPTTDSSISSSWNGLISGSIESQETCDLCQNTSFLSDHLNDKSCHNVKTDVDYIGDPDSDVYRNFCYDGLEPERCSVSTSMTMTSQIIDNKDQDKCQSDQGQCQESVRAKMVTLQDDELVVTGKSFDIVLASRVLMKELNVKLVKLEAVTDKDNCHVRSCQSCPISNITSERVHGSHVRRSSNEQKGLNSKSLHYSKGRLLRLSKCLLSRQPPPMWSVIANTHTDCCLSPQVVREYFEPSTFQYHDGTFVVAKYSWEKDGFSD